MDESRERVGGEDFYPPVDVDVDVDFLERIVVLRAFRRHADDVDRR